ncbi:MAG: 2-C-methyl-D-erythritol 2,4-cyclodiphosphate synthase [Gammaproteobacteria bacterium]
MRIGHGYDVHRFKTGGRLVLGGVTIPYEKGLEAHSDGDVLIHAICDALLGAAALGDIGKHFPNTSEELKGIDSRVLLRRVAGLLHEQGFAVANVDATIVAEAPKIGPFVAEMRARLAADLGLVPDCVNVKATTTEGMGFTGEGRGVAAYAVALLSDQPPPNNG